ncbi:MAG: nicotinamide mononucleotide transporter [Bacteroidetes bacterium]|nr:nicotinamide mononucleotide transporter [Bacteroidota bacterium]
MEQLFIVLTVFGEFRDNLLNTGWLEFVAVVFGLLSVWFARKENILVYPTGIVSVVIYVYIYFQVNLYAGAGINFFYFVMSVYGWYRWAKKKDLQALKITACDRQDWIIAVVMFVLSVVVIIVLLKIFKKDDLDYWSTRVPYIDTFTTAVFIVGMWLMAVKKIENWIAWIIGDIISIPLFIYKGLAFTGFQFMVFLALAVMGYISWKRKLVFEHKD